MHRRNFYHMQRVLEGELDKTMELPDEREKEEALEYGMSQAAAVDTPDASVCGGILSGLVVTRLDDTTVSVTAGACRDQQGRRIELPSAATVKVTYEGAAEEGDLTYAQGPSLIEVPGGSEAWLGIFLAYDEHLSDPREDGLGNAVYFQIDESFHFHCVLGTPGTPPCLNQVPLTDNRVLLTEVLLADDQTIKVLAGPDSICCTSEEFDDLGGASAYAALVGHRSDHLACDSAADFPQYQAQDLELRAKSSREAVYKLTKQLQKQSAAPAGASLVGARAQTGAGVTYEATTAQAVTAGSVDSQIKTILDHLTKMLFAGGDATLRPTAGATAGLILDPATLTVGRRLLTLMGYGDGASQNLFGIGKRGHPQIPHVFYDCFDYGSDTDGWLPVVTAAAGRAANPMAKWTITACTGAGSLAKTSGVAVSTTPFGLCLAADSTPFSIIELTTGVSGHTGYPNHARWNCGAAPYAIASVRFKTPTGYTKADCFFEFRFTNRVAGGSACMAGIRYYGNQGKMYAEINGTETDLGGDLTNDKWRTVRIAILAQNKMSVQWNDEVSGESAETVITDANPTALDSSSYNFEMLLSRAITATGTAVMLVDSVYASDGRMDVAL